MAEDKKPEMIFRYLLKYIIQRRWYVTAIVLGLFILILGGIFIGISTGSAITSEWKELLLLCLGAMIGSFGKVIEFWFVNQNMDTMMSQKADEEDGQTLSNADDFQDRSKPSTPIIPDAFIKGAEAARDLAVTENKQKFELAKDEQEHRQVMEIDQQEHKQEMEKLEFEYHAHRQCEHVWGDSDGDGELECQKCGLLKDK
jgi:hypothetical protein